MRISIESWNRLQIFWVLNWRHKTNERTTIKKFNITISCSRKNLFLKIQNDEPASALIERIRAEKEKLIKEKKIKPDKNPSYIFRGSDNLPYEKVGKNEPFSHA